MNQQNVILQQKAPIPVGLCLKQAFIVYQINVIAFKNNNKKPHTSINSHIRSTEIQVSVWTSEIAVPLI